MIRPSLLVICSLPLVPLLARTPPCVEPTACEYETEPIDASFETPWGSTVAEDLAYLEQPQHGTWIWGESTEYIEVDPSGVERPAIATFVPNPDGLHYTEHVDGGVGLACGYTGVFIDGTLTVVDSEDESLIISVPLRVSHLAGGIDTYSASPNYAPVDVYFPELTELAEWDTTMVFGRLTWRGQAQLLAEFYYFTQTQTSDGSEGTTVTGVGAGSLVGEFTASE